MRGCEQTPAEPSWEYRTAGRKNCWRGQHRVSRLGPKAREAIRGFQPGDPAVYLFSPRDSVGEHDARRAAARTTKRTPSEATRRVAATPGPGRAERYDRRTYRQAIVRACRRAGVPRWSPLQLSQTAATLFRARYGPEAVLGHSKPDTTLNYAERDLARAHAVAAEIG